MIHCRLIKKRLIYAQNWTVGLFGHVHRVTNNQLSFFSRKACKTRYETCITVCLTSCQSLLVLGLSLEQIVSFCRTMQFIASFTRICRGICPLQIISSPHTYTLPRWNFCWIWYQVGLGQPNLAFLSGFRKSSICK